MNYLVVTTKEWNIKAYEKCISKMDGNWSLITNKENLTLENVVSINPKYIYFPHWSWFVPKEITDNYNCVCFHMTDLPYGRGGSPLQNLIYRGHKTTKITALKMTNKIDAGDIYLKKSLDLSGSAQEIFIRSSEIISNMIKTIIENELKPKPQIGDSVYFDRRTPEQSKIPDNISLEQLYNHIRMLDADTYPKGYIDYGNFRLKFNKANLSKTGKLIANVEIEVIK